MRTISLLAAAVVLFSTAAGGADDRRAGPHGSFPGSQIVLQDGDVILEYAAEPIHALNRRFVHPRGPYGHSLLYIETQAGGRLIEIMPGGYKEHNPDERLENVYRMALLRPVAPPPPGRLAGLLEPLRMRVARGEVQFDFGFFKGDVDDGRFYCDELISFLIREAGAHDPFVASKTSRSFWSSWTRDHLGLEHEKIVSPNAILQSPHYRLIAEYRDESDKSSRRREVLLDAIFDRIALYVEEERRQPAPPSFGSYLLIGLVEYGWFSQTLLGKLSPRGKEIMMTVREFVVKVEQRIAHHLALHDEVDWPEEALIEMARHLADGYSERFFPPLATP